MMHDKEIDRIFREEWRRHLIRDLNYIEILEKIALDPRLSLYKTGEEIIDQTISASSIEPPCFDQTKSKEKKKKGRKWFRKIFLLILLSFRSLLLSIVKQISMLLNKSTSKEDRDQIKEIFLTLEKSQSIRSSILDQYVENITTLIRSQLEDSLTKAEEEREEDKAVVFKNSENVSIKSNPW